MSRYMDADDVANAIYHHFPSIRTMADARGVIEEVPSIDIVPRRGEWMVCEGGWKDFDYYSPKCKCNQCGYEEELYILNAKPTNFCPNCGADMRGKDDGCNGIT